MRGAVVAEASSRVGAQYLDETILDLVASLAPRGPLCDLGCGTGSRLLAMCTRAGQPGLGFDISAAAVDAAQRTVRDARAVGVALDIREADVARLTENRPEVDIVTQAFMTHHIAPDDHCVTVLRSYQERFPNARYLVVFDTVVSPTTSAPAPELFAPGFDYIHALQGMEPRTYAAARRVFAEAGYRCLREITLDVPNSYAWVLQPDGRTARP
ncbi:methyltransferase domain-containing protein [Streptomyces sp. NPDC015032]|uniref:class I SAM-dependent methyltransferase n=1 Tax=Streptomyces sp. NPDC015032 TaxID=3364937 RepID=UPI0036FE9053